MASASEEPNSIQEVYFERNLTILSKIFTYPEIDRIARHWLNLSDEEINEHKTEATCGECTTSHTYTYMVLKTWCNKNKGPDLLRRLHTTLKRARDVQENAMNIWVSVLNIVWKCCYSCHGVSVLIRKVIFTLTMCPPAIQFVFHILPLFLNFYTLKFMPLSFTTHLDLVVNNDIPFYNFY